MYIDYRSGYLCGAVSLFAAALFIDFIPEIGFYDILVAVIFCLFGLTLITFSILEGRRRRFDQKPYLKRHRVDCWFEKATRYL